MADAVFYPPTQSNPRASFSGNAGESPTFEAEIKTTRHEKLNGRDLQNQHPIGAITGLQEALNSKQPTINDLEDIRAGANKGSSAVQPNELEAVAETIPHNASDVNALPDTTKYGASILASLNQSTFVITIQLKDQNGNNLGSPQTVDLPLESVVVNGSYDSQNKKIVLTLENGNTIDVPVGDLVAGLQTEITSQNKLSADLVDDESSTNKFVTAQDKENWNDKQDSLSETQLEAVNSGITSGDVEQITTNKNAISLETTNRQNADNNLQSQIDAISASSDVTDIVGTYAELQAYDTSKLKDNDIVKVLQDESQNGETTYYRWNTHTETFSLIGEEGPYYTKSEADARFATATQGTKADTALQPSALNGYATEQYVDNIVGDIETLLNSINSGG